MKMDTIFMNSENSETSKPHILIFKLTDKLDFSLLNKEEVKKLLFYRILVSITSGKT